VSRRRRHMPAAALSPLDPLPYLPPELPALGGPLHTRKITTRGRSGEARRCVLAADEGWMFEAYGFYRLARWHGRYEWVDTSREGT